MGECIREHFNQTNGLHQIFMVCYMASLYFHRQDLKQDFIWSSKFRDNLRVVSKGKKCIQVKKIAHKSVHNSVNEPSVLT